MWKGSSLIVGTATYPPPQSLQFFPIQKEDNGEWNRKNALSVLSPTLKRARYTPINTVPVVIGITKNVLCVGVGQTISSACFADLLSLTNKHRERL